MDDSTKPQWYSNVPIPSDDEFEKSMQAIAARYNRITALEVRLKQLGQEADYDLDIMTDDELTALAQRLVVQA